MDFQKRTSTQIHCVTSLILESLATENLQPVVMKDIFTTCMPNILHPYIGTGSKEQPMHWYEEKADHVASQSNANEEY